MFKNGVRSLLVAAAGVGALPAFGEPMFLGLGDLDGGAISSIAYDASEDGTFVVGQASGEAFRWDAVNGMQGLGNLSPNPSYSSVAYAVSDDGSVVVGAANSSSTIGTVRGFRWDAVNGMLEIPPLFGDNQNQAFAVNGDGNAIVGESMLTNSHNEAFIWDDVDGLRGMGALPGHAWSYAHGVSGVVAELPEPVNTLTVVGWSHISGETEAFRWDIENGMQGLGFLYEGNSSFAEAVSSDGAIAVGRSAGDGFIWSATTGMQTIGDLPEAPGFAVDAYDVSSDGSVVVGRANTPQGYRAVIWDATNGLRTVSDALAEAGVAVPAGWTLFRAMGVSGDGTMVVGQGRSPDGYNEAWVAVVPEPDPSMCVLAGVLLLVALRRRRVVRVRG